MSEKIKGLALWLSVESSLRRLGLDVVPDSDPAVIAEARKRRHYLVTGRGYKYQWWLYGPWRDGEGQDPAVLARSQDPYLGHFRTSMCRRTQWEAINSAIWKEIEGGEEPWASIIVHTGSGDPKCVIRIVRVGEKKEAE